MAVVLPWSFVGSPSGRPGAPHDDEAVAARKLVRAVAGYRGRFDALHFAGTREKLGASDLLAQLLGLQAVATVKASSGVRLRAMMAARVRADFVAGRTEIVGGWVLSRTERQLARVSAIVADAVRS
jgi:hypothetical protein